MSITAQIEELLRGTAGQAPGVMSDYGNALSTAQGQEQQSIDDLGKIYNDPSKFERSQLGALGLGLMAPTSSGNFSESLYNGLKAAADAQDYNREANLTREEKLAKLAALQAALTRQKATDSVDIFDKKIGMANTLGGVDNQLKDIELETPGDAGLSFLERAQHTYSDYLANPQRYAGPQGQALVKNAIDVLNNERTNSRYERIAELRATNAGRPYTPDAGTKKAIREAASENVTLEQSLANLKRAYELANTANAGYFAGSRGKVAENLPDWMVPDAVFGSPEQGKDTGELGQIMDLEAIKGVGAYLKGPTSDRDVKLMLDTLADPNASVKRKQAAIDRVMRQVEAQIEFNKDYANELKSGDAYRPGGGGGASADEADPDLGFDPEALPDDVKAWVKEQIEGGADEAQIIDYLRENFGGQ